MVHMVPKAVLPSPSSVLTRLKPAATMASCVALREPRPAGFPLLFTDSWQLIEPAVAFLHEHFVQRAHSIDTLRTYAEILSDWFSAIERNGVRWDEADAVDLVAYRNRMLTEASMHTGRSYGISTINHRVRGVLRFYKWAVRAHWLEESPLALAAGTPRDFGVAKAQQVTTARDVLSRDRGLFVLRQFEALPRPLTSEQALELLARLPPPYDLMARWQLYTGLRVSELLRLLRRDVATQPEAAACHTVDVMRKGRKSGYVIASASLLDESAAYLCGYRRAWLQRAHRRGRPSDHNALFINARGVPVCKNTYQNKVSRTARAYGFKATTHTLRATFACMLLARLQRLASEGAAINPLMIVKVLMGHEHIETTDVYLRAIAADSSVLKDALAKLLSSP